MRACSCTAAGATWRKPRSRGLRLLDLSTVVAGPFATELLGHLGMDVIRIEPPPAEAPPPQKPHGARVTEPEGFRWSLARNKRSVCLDLKMPIGRAVFLDLVRIADIVYENFRPGVLRRLATKPSSSSPRSTHGTVNQRYCSSPRGLTAAL